MRGRDYKPLGAHRYVGQPGMLPPKASERALMKIREDYGEVPPMVPTYRGACRWKRRRNAQLQQEVNRG